MQRVRPKRSQARSILILVGIVLVLGIIVYGVVTLLSPTQTTAMQAYQMPCKYDDTLKPFGPYMLYYDGGSIHCMSSMGNVRWSFPIGSNGGYDCTDQKVVAWSGNTIYILDENGKSSYNDNLGEAVQFARIGKQYVAAVIGSTIKPRLLVKDHTGAHMDEEADAYQDLILLDVGFYGENGKYMWTLALDVFGTAANTIMNTFEVGKSNTGEVGLGENAVYKILYENSNLRVVSTRKMHFFTYQGTEDIASSVLVYGWKLIASESFDRGEALMLFAPTSQTDSQFDIRELRLIKGKQDKRYSLPDTCVGAAVWNQSLYAISGDKIFGASLNANRFTTYDIPLNQQVTRFIGVTSNGSVLVACGDEVFAITLPTLV